MANRATPDAIDGDQLAAAFGMKPEAAIRFFESLGIKISWNWQRDAAEAKDLGFYVAKITEREVLAAIKQEIGRALELGLSQSQFRAFLTGRLAQLGWIGEREVVSPDGEVSTVDISTPSRMDLIFRTNAQTAYNAGRYVEQLAMSSAAPYWQYLAVLDSRTRVTHAYMSGRVFRFDDPIWQTIYPPCGYNCRCRVRVLTQAAFDASGEELLTGATFDLPQGFPDEGFGFNPANGAALQQQLSAAAARAQQRVHESFR